MDNVNCFEDVNFFGLLFMTKPIDAKPRINTYTNNIMKPTTINF